MHGYRTSHGGDLNENTNFIMWRLIRDGYKNSHGAILTKINIMKREKNILILLFS